MNPESGSAGPCHGIAKRLMACGIVFMLLGLAACGGGGGSGSGSGSPGDEEEPPTVTSIALQPDTVAIGRGSTRTLRVTANTSDDRTVGINNSNIDWELVDAPASPVASVSDAGVITGRRIGNALIRAHFNEHSDQSEVAVSALQVRPESIELPLDCRRQLRAHLVSSDGATRDVTGNTDWSVFGDAFERVDNAEEPGLVRAVGAGSSIVQVRYPDLGTAGVEATGRLAALELADADSIAIDAGAGSGAIDLRLAEGESRRVSVSAADRDLTECAEWSSSEPEVAAVGADGVIRARGPGEADVTASYRGYEDVIRVEVADDSVTDLSIGAVERELTEGETVQLHATATVSGEAGEPVDVTNTVQWRSDKPDVASVSNDPATAGLVTGLAPDPGRNPVTITASLEELDGACGADEALCDTAEIEVTSAGEPTDLNVSAEPNVVLPEGAGDSSLICARLVPNEAITAERDIGFTVQGGTGTVSDASVPTEDGEACVTFSPGLEAGLVDVLAEEPVSGLGETATVEVVESFASVFGSASNRIEPPVGDDNIAKAGTIFEAVFVNGSNREFEVRADTLAFCKAGGETINVTADLAGNNRISAGGRVAVSVEINRDHTSPGFAIALLFSEVDGGGAFEFEHQFTDTDVECTPR